jgi:hypothetical protein
VWKDSCQVAVFKAWGAGRFLRVLDNNKRSQQKKNIHTQHEVEIYLCILHEVVGVLSNSKSLCVSKDTGNATNADVTTHY